jgi:hypothetical protein
MNWGVKITIVIFVFIATMIGMVVVAFQQTNEMTDANYYQKELVYQKLIDAADNLHQKTKEDILIQDKNGLHLVIPHDLLQGFKLGKCEMLRWSDQSRDLSFNFFPDADGRYHINTSSLIDGRYTARISWESLATPYYREEQIFIKK